MATLPPNSYMPSVSLVILNGVGLLASKKEISTLQKVGMIASAAFQAFRPHFEENLNERWGEENVFPCCNALPFVVMLFAVWKKEASWEEWGRATAIWGAVHCLTGFLARAIYYQPPLHPPPLQTGVSFNNQQETPLWIRDHSKEMKELSKTELQKRLNKLNEDKAGKAKKGRGSYKENLNASKKYPNLFLGFVKAYCRYQGSWEYVFKYIKKKTFESLDLQLNAWNLLLQEPFSQIDQPIKITIRVFNSKICSLEDLEKEKVCRKMVNFFFEHEFCDQNLLNKLLDISDLDGMIYAICHAIEKNQIAFNVQEASGGIFKRCSEAPNYKDYLEEVIKSLETAQQPVGKKLRKLWLAPEKK
ncbi:hypothetical protein [Candidatus Neptunochlamydia vexilliferae]|uniref:Uncharacterized protein n=1 Tax=Candidatus Neptunichlamydia vexilliferae TaxID=1651774 RepID=A0ABS0B036_9BACT|nr:hypothetical protein [Candidatus Neptunochlamydia vexilliferae]MBF5059731.1 hypothetical protein [Candidatus Neptunochlamydia vexilliferae]